MFTHDNIIIMIWFIRSHSWIGPNQEPNNRHILGIVQLRFAYQKKKITGPLQTWQWVGLGRQPCMQIALTWVYKVPPVHTFRYMKESHFRTKSPDSALMPPSSYFHVLLISLGDISFVWNSTPESDYVFDLTRPEGQRSVPVKHKSLTRDNWTMFVHVMNNKWRSANVSAFDHSGLHSSVSKF